MTNDHEDLIALKVAAKVFAKRMDVPRHNALDVIAQICDHPRWTALAKAYDKGWRPTWLQVERAENLVYDIEAQATPPRDTSNDTPVVLKGHACTLTEDFMDVLIWGEHWCIRRGHAPSEPAEVETFGPCAIDDPEVLAEAMTVLNEAADRLRARIADDWPRDSMNPDAQGRVIHPLWSGQSGSSEWFCLHCDGKFTGTQMASNMWHCPECSATPIDMFPTPFWRGDSESAAPDPKK